MFAVIVVLYKLCTLSMFAVAYAAEDGGIDADSAYCYRLMNQEQVL